MIIAQGVTGRSTDEMTPRSQRLPLVVAIAANVVALVVFAASPHAEEHPAAALGIWVFLLAQILLPACRPVRESPLCPGNIAQAFFWVQLVLVPLLIGFYGIREGTLPRVPSGSAINLAIGLRVLAYLAFCVAYQLGSAAPPAAQDDRRSSAVRSSMTPLVIVFLGLGVLGMCLAYESLAGFLEFASSPAQQREREALPTTLAGAASTFLRPFLGFALILVWSGWLSREARKRSVLVCAVGTVALVLLLLLVNFSYNRGSLVAPVLAVAAAYSVHVRRISFLAVGVAATVVLFFALAFGWYRTTNLEISELTMADLSEPWSEDQIADFFQIYASGPQMTAYLIEERGEGSPLYLGRTLVCSALSPVPVLGKAFREGSGVNILNMLIYHDPEISDQLISYDAELYINFHIPGIVAGYALLGWLVRCCQGRFLSASQAIENYSWMLVTLWLVFPGSLPVICQMCVYFFWPMYGYFAFKWINQVRFGELGASFQGAAKDRLSTVAVKTF